MMPIVVLKVLIIKLRLYEKLINSIMKATAVLIMAFYVNNHQQRRIIQHFHSSPAKIRGHVTSPLIKGDCIVFERTCPHIFATVSEQKRNEF